MHRKKTSPRTGVHHGPRFTDHILTLIMATIVFSVVMSSDVHGQTARRSLPVSVQIDTDVQPAKPEEVHEGMTVSLKQVFVGGRSHPGDRRAHVSFKIRFGRVFSITVTKS
jgi:hypothetical protein